MAMHTCPTSCLASSASKAPSAGQRCLSENDVLDLVADAMGPGTRQRADAHLLSCSDCRRLVSEAVLALAPDDPAALAPVDACPVVLPQVGDIIEGKYRIERVVGHGGMGVVFAANHLMLDHPVALKFLWSRTVLSETSKQRFLREGRAALRIESDHITRVMDVGVTEQGAPFVVMELLQGRDIRSVLLSEGPFPWCEVVQITMQALEAVGAAHDAGVVHRDLKPANLFLVQTQHDRRVKVLDFGVSKITSDPSSSSLTSTEAMLGSPAYMAPEQMEDSSKVDARADVWSMGATMFEMITGKPPFSGVSVAALHRSILESKGVSVRDHAPDVPKSINVVIRRCLSVIPGDRYPNGRALLKALEEAMRDPEAVRSRPPLWKRRASRRIAIATAAVVVLLAAWLRWGARPASPVEAPAAAAPSSASAQHAPPSVGADSKLPDRAGMSDTPPTADPARTQHAASSVPRVHPPAARRAAHATPPLPTASAGAVHPSSNRDPDPHAPGLSDRK